MAAASITKNYMMNLIALVHIEFTLPFGCLN